MYAIRSYYGKFRIFTLVVFPDQTVASNAGIESMVGDTIHEHDVVSEIDNVVDRMDVVEIAEVD